MKILSRRKPVADGPGSVKMIPVESDDLWAVFNLVAVGDKVRAPTVRKVLIQSKNREYETDELAAALLKQKKQKSESFSMVLEIKVEEIDYDKEGSVLGLRGKNMTQNNEHVKFGAFHTLKLELHRPFILIKKTWDSVAIDLLKQASKPAGSSSGDVAVILMQEGLANLFLVGHNMTTTRSRIETPIPRKHGNNEILSYDKALNHFFDRLVMEFVKHINFNVARCVVIASPGFTKDQFLRHLLLEAQRRGIKTITENKSRIILAHSSSGYKHSLKDLLDDLTVKNLIKDTKAAMEVRALKDFFAMLSKDLNRVCYGTKHVEIAHERLAIQTLLITDELFRNSDVLTRLKYVKLVDSVKDAGGTVHIFSSMHVSGEQLAQLTGIAAILRFPLPELEDIEM